jgi:pyranose oxidase
MGVHWTCAIPRENPEVERSKLLSDEEWDALYDKAEELLCRHDDVFDDSIRHTVVRDTIFRHFPNRGVRNLPQAVQPNPHDMSLVRWTGPDVVLGDKLTAMLRDSKQEQFRIVPEHICYQLGKSEDNQTIKVALCTDLTTAEEVIIEANEFVVCCGATRTPQLLHASGIRPKALGHFLCEQPYTFCQVVLKEEIIRSIENMTFGGLTDDMKKRIHHHKIEHPHDPVPIPIDDKAPQV